MPQEYDAVISDTSCFILLDKINELELLQLLFGKIFTTDIIASEYGKQLPDWVIVKSVTSTKYLELLQLEVDKGEASAIALSAEFTSALLVLDDNKARKLATRLNLAFTGTLGILVKAKQVGILPEIMPILKKIQSTNFRFSDKTFREILSIVGE